MSSVDTTNITNNTAIATSLVALATGPAAPPSVPPAAAPAVAVAVAVTYEMAVRSRVLQHTPLILDLVKIVQTYAAFSGEERITLSGHTSLVFCVAVFSDGHICSGSDDNSIKIWNRDGRCLQTLTGKYIFIYL